MLIRLSFHVRATLPFVSIVLEPLEGKERTCTSRIDHRKTRSNFFKNPFEFLPGVAPVSFDYREKTSSPPRSLLFLSLRHTGLLFHVFSFPLFPLFLSCRLLFSSSPFFFFFTYRNSSDSPVFDALCRASAPRVSRHRSSLKLSHSSN